MKKTAVKFVFAGIAACFLATSPMLAHHSFEAEYDSNKAVNLVGTVTKFEWTNPHARFYVDVKDSQGNVENWNLELASPNVLSRQGWRRDSLKIGDQITVNAWAAKDGTRLANAKTVTLADGRKVFAGSVPETGSK